MKIKAIVFALAVFFTSAIVCSAQSPHMGTWKLNEAKSKFATGATKNHTVVYEAAADQIKITVDGMDGAGATVHNEWTGKFDGEYYAVTGSPTADQRAYWRVHSHTLKFREKKGRRVVLTGQITVSPNGKTRTVWTTGQNAHGKVITNTAVYDKQ